MTTFLLFVFGNFLVFFFSGSIVLIAAHDLRHTKLFSRNSDGVSAKELIRALKGDPLNQNSDSMVEDPGSSPRRGSGEFLKKEDRKKINSFIRGILPKSSSED